MPTSAGGSSHPCASAFLPTVRVAKSKRKTVVNVWMVVTMFVGTAIVLADGLSRGPITEREAYWNGPLEYQPYAGAICFAVVSLFLMFLYVRRAKFALTEGLFLWFVFCPHCVHKRLRLRSMAGDTVV